MNFTSLPPKYQGRLALRISEAAELVGCSTSTISNLVARGVLPGRDVGSGRKAKTYVIPLSGLLQWLGGQEPKP